MTRLQQIVVSRKTPLDGKLEISGATASRLAASGTGVQIEIDGALGAGDLSPVTATVSEMQCTCARSQRTGVHVHHFLGNPRFASLAIDARLVLSLDDDGAVHLGPDVD